VAAINAMAARRQTAALSDLLTYSGDSDSTVRRAAYAALRGFGGDAEIPALAEQVLAGKTEAAGALEAAAQRATDKPAAVKKLLAMAGGDEQKVAALVETLSALGGDEALAALNRLVSSSSPDTQNAAVRALGTWADFSASKPLLAIAGNKEAQLNQHVLAVQGLAALVRSAEAAPAASRVELALAAYNAARRLEEKKLILSALGAVPDRRAAEALKPFLKDPQFKTEACAAALSLGEALARSDRRTARELATEVKTATDDASLVRRADRILSR